jgi:hypothetical protein
LIACPRGEEGVAEEEEEEEEEELVGRYYHARAIDLKHMSHNQIRPSTAGRCL